VKDRPLKDHVAEDGGERNEADGEDLSGAVFKSW